MSQTHGSAHSSFRPALTWLLMLVLAGFVTSLAVTPVSSKPKKPKNKAMRRVVKDFGKDVKAFLKQCNSIGVEISDTDDFDEFMDNLEDATAEAFELLEELKTLAVLRLFLFAVEPAGPGGIIGAPGGDLTRALCQLDVICKCAAAGINEWAARFLRLRFDGLPPLIAVQIFPPPVLIPPIPPIPAPLPKPIKIEWHAAGALQGQPGRVCVGGSAEPGTVIDIDLTCGGQSFQAQVVADGNCKWRICFSGINGPINCTFQAVEQGNPTNNDSRTIGSC